MTVRVVSDIQKIDSAIADVFAFFSDFTKIGRLADIARQAGAGQQVPAEVADKIEEVRTTTDTCTLVVKGIGEMGLKIVERQEPTLVKMEGDGRMPFEVHLWVQLLSNGPYDTRMRLTLEADMNMMLKMMLKGKLEKGINQAAEALAKIPYAYMK